jgi:hypothetical protein
MSKKLLGKLRPFDLIIIAIVLIAIVVGIFTITGKRATSSGQIIANTQVAIEVYIRGATVTSQNPLFAKGGETFMTIRNVPYKKLQIKDVKFERKRAIVPTPNSKQPFVVVEDVTAPNQWDFLITLTDDAKITADGAVVGGNKIKIGMPVTLEGVDYRLNGTVANVTLDRQPQTKGSDELQEQVNENQDVD